MSLNKTSNTAGFGSTYSFNVIFTTLNSYGPGIWVIVEFPFVMPPKLNKFGSLRCA